LKGHPFFSKKFKETVSVGITFNCCYPNLPDASRLQLFKVWVTFTTLLYKTDFLPVAPYFDELIVTELRKKNDVALRELYKTHYSMVVHLVCSNSGTEQEAKDIYQEAVMAFYERVQ
jgi:hypothetical protein